MDFELDEMRQQMAKLKISLRARRLSTTVSFVAPSRTA